MECILNPGVPCDNIMNYAYIIWFALGILLIVLEFFIPGVFIIFFGIYILILKYLKDETVEYILTEIRNKAGIKKNKSI